MPMRYGREPTIAAMAAAASSFVPSFSARAAASAANLWDIASLWVSTTNMGTSGTSRRAISGAVMAEL